MTDTYRELAGAALPQTWCPGQPLPAQAAVRNARPPEACPYSGPPYCMQCRSGHLWDASRHEHRRGRVRGRAA